MPKKIKAGWEEMIKYPAKIIEYEDYNESLVLECPVCSWKGPAKDNIEYYDALFDVSCPNCEKMLLVVNYPMNPMAKKS